MPAAARLLRVPLDGAPAPQDVLRALRDEAWPFALVGDWAGGGAIVGAAPLRVAEPDDDPFALLDAVPPVEPAGEDGDAVGGGWFGWLGYGLGAHVERLSPPPPRPVPLPSFQLAYYDHVLRLDPRGRWWFEALATPARERALKARLAELRARMATAAELPPTASGPPARFRLHGAGAAGHLAAVEACRERIAAGEIFQANVCLRLEAAWQGEVAELFAHASARLAPAFGAAFPAPWGGVASLSPELFLRRRGREVLTAPIKGTVARTPGRDEQAERAALQRSAKDRAEHVMIVDLMRNDLGRVCEYGSVAAEPEPALEPHPGVWHLVSRVRGRLRPDATDAALLRATFPPGSVTGAPKVQALHVISELEGTAREAYTGAIGFASPLAGLELNVAIRTFEVRDGRVWLGAGGGVVADSDPKAELDECLAKARPLIAAIGGRIEGAAVDADRAGGAEAGCLCPAPAGRGARPGDRTRPQQRWTRARPDPSQGVFETLLVLDGEAIRAEQHLARLAASVASLYDATLPDGLAEEVAATAARADRSAGLRILAHPRGRNRVETTVELAERRRRPQPIELRPVTLPGGLGSHKWRDRRLLDALSRDGTTPLLLDADGAVLEAAWGNVFALEGGTLVTPPADGRLLPGVTRAALLAAAPVLGLAAREEQLPLERLAQADAIVLTSALAGAAPGRLEANVDEPGASALVRRFAALAIRPSAPIPFLNSQEIPH